MRLTESWITRLLTVVVVAMVANVAVPQMLVGEAVTDRKKESCDKEQLLGSSSERGVLNIVFDSRDRSVVAVSVAPSEISGEISVEEARGIGEDTIELFLQSINGFIAPLSGAPQPDRKGHVMVSSRESGFSLTERYRTNSCDSGSMSEAVRKVEAIERALLRALQREQRKLEEVTELLVRREKFMKTVLAVIEGGAGTEQLTELLLMSDPDKVRKLFHDGQELGSVSGLDEPGHAPKVESTGPLLPGPFQVQESAGIVEAEGVKIRLRGPVEEEEFEDKLSRELVALAEEKEKVEASRNILNQAIQTLEKRLEIYSAPVSRQREAIQEASGIGMVGF